MNKYTVDYFIEKFKAIPEHEIGTCQRTGCAYGQCASDRHLQNGDSTKEGKALTKLMSSLPNLTKTRFAIWNPYESTPARINNGDVEQYQQPSPKKRILAALYDIKMLNSEQEAQVSDTTKADQGTEAGEQYPDIRKSLAILPENKLEVDVKVKEVVNG